MTALERMRALASVRVRVEISSGVWAKRVVVAAPARATLNWRLEIEGMRIRFRSVNEV